MLERLKEIMAANDTLKMPKLEIQFCRSSTVPRPASALFLPIMIHQCPDNFSTVEYFEVIFLLNYISYDKFDFIFNSV